MAEFLGIFIPRHWPDVVFQCVPHDGKKDLIRSIPRKLRAWTEPDTRFVVVIDNDGGDCIALKHDLINLCLDAGRADTLIRIVCQELESWYLGDPQALSVAFGDNSLSGISKRAKFRLPDAVQKPSAAMKSLVPSFQKVSGARLMGTTIGRVANSSASFMAFVQGVDRIVA